MDTLVSTVLLPVTTLVLTVDVTETWQFVWNA